MRCESCKSQYDTHDPTPTRSRHAQPAMTCAPPSSKWICSQTSSAPRRDELGNKMHVTSWVIKVAAHWRRGSPLAVPGWVTEVATSVRTTRCSITNNMAAIDDGLCQKPRGLLTMGLRTPMTIGRIGFLRVESGGGPENQDENMDRGVH